MNLSTCIHHLTRGENVNYYTTDELVYMYTSFTRGENVNYYITDELVYMYTSSYSRRER